MNHSMDLMTKGHLISYSSVKQVISHIWEDTEFVNSDQLNGVPKAALREPPLKSGRKG